MKLIEDWAHQLRRAWSIRLAGFAGVVGAYFVAYPGELEKITAIVPEQWRGPFGVLAGLLIFSTATGSRVVRQGKREG